MDEGVTLAREGRVAVIEIDNPPINALGGRIRQALLAALTQAGRDDTIDAVVLAGRGRLMSGGADLREFGKPPMEPGLSALILAFERSAKPVVVALHGAVYGGGYELALGCHYRIAAPDARLGLPEVKLGLIPGAGGTQRLPRLIGPLAALAPIVTGAPMPADEALALGIIDRVAATDLRAAAIRFAAEIAGCRPLPRVSEMEAALADARRAPEGFETGARALLAQTRGLEAPIVCVQAIRNTLSMPFDAGQAEERRLFHVLRDSAESKALRYLFFAERAAAKGADPITTTAAREHMARAPARQIASMRVRGLPPAAIDRAALAYGFAAGPCGTDGADAPPSDEQDITDRLVLSLVNAGAELLEAGTVARASDLDLIAVTALGFPRGKGGPLYAADQTGLPQVVARLAQLADPDLAPAPLLRRLAETGERLADFGRNAA